MLKFLTYFARDWYFVCNQDFGPFDHGWRLLGPIVAITAAGCHGQGHESNATAQLLLNAATETLIGYSGTPDSGVTATAGARTIGNSTMTPGGPAIDCTAIITVTRRASQSAGPANATFLNIGWDDAGTGTYTWSADYYYLTTTDQNFTLQFEASHLGTNSGSAKVTMAYHNTGGTNATVSASPAHTQVEFIKR